MTGPMVNGPVEWLKDALQVIALAKEENKSPRLVVMVASEFASIERLIREAVEVLPGLIDPDRLADWKCDRGAKFEDVKG